MQMRWLAVGIIILTTAVSFGATPAPKVYLQDVLSSSPKSPAPGASTHIIATENGSLVYVPYTSVRGPKGDPGPAGQSGASFTWGGDWNNSRIYDANTAVARNGSSYISLHSNSNVDPALDSGRVYWAPMVMAGADGQAYGTVEFDNISSALRNNHQSVADMVHGDLGLESFVTNDTKVNGHPLVGDVQIDSVSNAGTAYSLVNTPVMCPVGQFPRGVSPNGDAAGCVVPPYPTYSLPTATPTTLGGVKPDGTSVLNSAGVLSVTPASIGAQPLATAINTGNIGSQSVASAATASALTQASSLPNGTTGTTQSTGDSSTKVSTDQFVANSIAAAASSYATASQGSKADSALQPFGAQTRYYVYAAPTSGNGSPIFRALTSADVPFAATTDALTAYLLSSTASSTYHSKSAFNSYSTSTASKLATMTSSLAGKQAVLGNYSCAGSAYMKEYKDGSWICSTPATGGGTGNGTITSVTGSAPISSTGGTTPQISISAATTSNAGSMSSTDKTKLDAYPTYGGPYATAARTVNGHALTSDVTVSASDLTTGTLPHAQLPTLLSGDIPNNTANTTGTAAGLSQPIGFGVYSSSLRANATPDMIGAATAAQGAKADSALQPFGSQLANYILAGPTTGSPATMAPRLLVSSDIPSLPWSKITSGIPSYLLSNQNITLSGDVTGSGTTSITSTLSSSGVVAGSYSNPTFTVDAKGRVTTASSGNAPSVAVGAVSTGAAGTSAAVTNSGTSLNATLNFTIPRGATGTAGADGAGISTGSDGQYGWLTNQNTSNYNLCTSGYYGMNWISGVLYQCRNGVNTPFNSGYTLPTATSTTLGGVKPDGTSILNTGGAISATATSVGAVPAGSLGSMSTINKGTLVNGMFCNYTTAGGGTIHCNSDPPGGTGSMVYPSGSGVPVVSSGTSWGTTVAAPAGDIVGTTDAQTLTNKTLNDPIIAVGTPSLGSGYGAGMEFPGTGMTIGDLYSESSGTYAPAKANSTTSMPAVCLAVSTSKCVFSGVYKFSSNQGWAVGNILYPSAATAGALTATAPSTSGTYVQPFGVALANDTILIMPSLMMAAAGTNGSGVNFVQDSFVAAVDTVLSSHVGEVGATWTIHPNYSGTATITSSDSSIYAAAANTLYYASGTPPSADYSVYATIHADAAAANTNAGVVGRCSTTTSSYYAGQFIHGSGWRIGKYILGTLTQIGSYWGPTDLTNGQDYNIQLKMNGTTLSLYVNGALAISGTDTDLPNAGKAGIKMFGTGTYNGSYELKNFYAGQ